MTRYILSLLLLTLFSAELIAGPGFGGIDQRRNRINRLFVISIGVSSDSTVKSKPSVTEADDGFYFSFPCYVCLADAEGMSRYFSSLAKKNKSIDTVISRIFINSSAPFDSVINAFRQVQLQSRPEDVFVFYYAGISWGTAQTTDGIKESFYATSPKVKNYDAIHSFRLSQLKTLTDRIAAKRQLIIFDSGQGDAIQTDFYRHFFNDKPSEALFTKKERVIICPENYSSESRDSSGTYKGDMFKIVSGLPAALNVFQLFDNKNSAGMSYRNKDYKQFMQLWYKAQETTVAQVKILREVDYLRMLTSLPSAETGKRGNALLVKEKPVDTALVGRKKIALIIASDNYQAATWDPLRNAIKDGQAVAAELKQQGYEVRPLYNSGQDDILNAISRLAEEANNLYDQYIVYFAGHGFYDARQQAGYIVCTDSKALKDPSKPAASELRSYIDYTVLFRNLEQLNKVVLITDVCFGGTSMNSQLQSKSIASPVKNNQLKNPYRRVLSSGVTAVDDFVRMHNGSISGHSPFAEALLTEMKVKGKSFELLFAGLLQKKLPVKPIEFYFGENIKPNEFIF